MPDTLSLTPLVFRERFTDAEIAACWAAAPTTPAVAVVLTHFLCAERIRFDDPRLGQGLDVLVAAGILTSERKATILNVTL